MPDKELDDNWPIPLSALLSKFPLPISSFIFFPFWISRLTVLLIEWIPLELMSFSQLLILVVDNFWLLMMLLNFSAVFWTFPMIVDDDSLLFVE